MQKVVSFLEKNVQWVAIGLGGIYLLWMVWGYVLNNPAKVSVAGANAPMSPSEVDRFIEDTTAQKLDVAMQSESVVPLPAPNYDKILAGVLNPPPIDALASGQVHTSLTTPII